MKFLSLLLLLALQLCALGAQRVSLAWDASPDASVTGYMLYVGTNGSGKFTQVIPLGLPLLRYDTNAPPPPPPSTTNSSLTVSATNSTYAGSAPLEFPPSAPVSSCTNSVCTQYGVVYTGLVSGVTYYFMVTAYDAAGIQSDPSNELSYTTWGFGIQTPILRKY